MFQNLGLLSVLGAVVAAWWLWNRVPRVKALPVVWSRSLPVSVAAQAVVAVQDKESFLLVPTESGRLQVLRARDGAIRDIALAAFPLRAQPSVQKQIAFVPAEDGALYAVNWTTGRTVWRFDSGAAMTTRPVLVQLPVAAPTPPTPPVPAASVPGAATAATGAPVQTATPAAPPSTESVVVAGNDEGMVVALRARDGKVLWRRALNAPVGDGLSVWNDAEVPRLFVPVMGGVTTRGGVRCLDARTGREVWKYPADPKIYAAHLPAPAMTVQGGDVQLFCVSDEGLVSCLQARSGKLWWKRYLKATDAVPADTLPVLRCEPLAITIGNQTRVVVAGNDGGVRCLDARLPRDGVGENAVEARTERVLWNFNAGGSVRGLLAVTPAPGAEGETGGTTVPLLMVGTDASTVHLLRADDGRGVARAVTGSDAVAGAVVVGDLLICLGEAGRIEAFDWSDARWLAAS
jgi:outer membrane protein assembly factor BamB